MKRIKRIYCMIILISGVALLIGCINRKRNYFVIGKFKANFDSINYYLEIDEISKDEYNSSNLINVVEDKVLKKDNYFKINFYKNDNDNITIINLINLQDQDPQTSSIPISYCDDNDINIMPYYPYDIENDYYYLTTYQTFYLYFERIN